MPSSGDRALLKFKDFLNVYAPRCKKTQTLVAKNATSRCKNRKCERSLNNLNFVFQVRLSVLSNEDNGSFEGAGIRSPDPEELRLGGNHVWKLKTFRTKKKKLLNKKNQNLKKKIAASEVLKSGKNRCWYSPNYLQISYDRCLGRGDLWQG